MSTPRPRSNGRGNRALDAVAGERALRLAADGKTATEIAERLGCGRETVARFLRSRGMVSTNRGQWQAPTADTAERVRRQRLREATTRASTRVTMRGIERDNQPAPVTLPRISCLEKKDA